MASIIVLLLVCLLYCGYYGYRYYKLKDKVGNLHQVERSTQEAETNLNGLRDQQFTASCELNQIQEQIEKGAQEIAKVQANLIGLRASQNELNQSLDTARGQVQNQLALLQEYETLYASTQQMHNERCKKVEDEANAKITLTEQECARIIGERRMAAQQVVDQLAIDVENERQKYLSIVATIVNAQTDEERDALRHVKVNEADQDDIGYLLNNVVRHLSNPDILYKLIWSEYIQKATNEMLDYILPQKDCPGIYKITNDRNKKSYIGRSTSVRKRLADHIKSAIGISTIANQKIHEIMREEGIWNFTFELIEECDKDKLSEREKYYIDFFQTADTTYGYNQKAGG